MSTLVCRDSFLKTCHWKIPSFLPTSDFWHYPMSQPGRRSQLIFSHSNEPGMAHHMGEDLIMYQHMYHIYVSYICSICIIYVSAAHKCSLLTIAPLSGGPMPKQVLGNGWQGPNKPLGSLDERLPELRRPPSLSMSPLRARRRSFVSVLTGREEKYLKVPRMT